jgi:hypothetical protein
MGKKSRRNVKWCQREKFYWCLMVIMQFYEGKCGVLWPTEFTRVHLHTTCPLRKDTKTHTTTGATGETNRKCIGTPIIISNIRFSYSPNIYSQRNCPSHSRDCIKLLLFQFLFSHTNSDRSQPQPTEFFFVFVFAAWFTEIFGKKKPQENFPIPRSNWWFDGM